MKKYLLIFGAACVLSLNLSACAKNADNKNNLPASTLNPSSMQKTPIVQSTSNVQMKPEDNLKTSNKEQFSSDAYSQFHHIAIGNLFLGGFKDKKWISAEKLKDKTLGNEKYNIYSRDKLIKTIDGAQISVSPASGSLRLNIVKDEDTTQYFVGISADWDVLPIKPKEVTDTAPYTKYVETILKENNISAKAEIQKVYTVDLLKDGNERIYVEASNIKNLTKSEKNNYSVVLHIKRIQDNINCDVIDGFFNNVTETQDILNEKKSIYGFADLNGDGALEILLESKYYEGCGYSIYQYKGGEYEMVLSASDGA